MRYWSLSFLLLAGFNLFIWYQVITGAKGDLNLYFLKVGQGDSELVQLPGGVQILIDGGPDKSVLIELAKALPANDRYLDMLVMTHPQTDHFAGFFDVVERYKVGAFITTGREGETETWEKFRRLLEEKQIPVILVRAGDKIIYKNSRFEVLSPDSEMLRDKELNESSIILKLESEEVKALFTGDAGFKAENRLLLAPKADSLNIDVLKVGHHGSRLATGVGFLAVTSPLISVIEVGQKNRYGHPTEATLNRLKSIGSAIYRTDENGTVRLRIKCGRIAVYP
ncbi:MAG: MBL fold metallo-hydrolase, partial [bacterium]|nr:MBL fold metallo-hydrolase [bacterium]